MRAAERKLYMIYFHEELVAKALKTIKDAADLVDVQTDMQMIENAQYRIQLFGDTITACKLNVKLRKKYPIIDKMLAFADTICSPVQQTPMSANHMEAVPEASALQQDRYGILCHVALEKGISQSIKQFIKSVD